MRNKLLSIMFLCALGLFAENAVFSQSSVTPLTIYTIRGPSGVGMIRLFENPPQAAGFQIKTEALAQADLMAAKFIAGEAKVGVLPPNLAAKIASSGKNIQIAAIVGTGMLSLLTSDPAITRIEDLKGKTVEVAGQGATPDYVFRRILSFKGLKPGVDVRLNYSLAYPEIAQSLIAGRVPAAILPEPFATMALSGRQDLRTVGDIQAEWVRAGGKANYPMTALVVDAEFAREHPDAIRTILADYRSSTEWVTAHPAEAGALVEKYDLGLRAAVVKAAIPKSNYVFIPAQEARPAIETLFRAFLEYAPESIGGVLPGDTFYR
ncbi:MAG: ABC transporter substrate-binding protein [Treponema sp.]|nr:ABC transporter substrate-binding protein [Treponema sp.]